MESFFSRYRNALVLIVVLVAQLLALAVQAKRPVTEGGDRRSVSLARFAVVALIAPPEKMLHATGHWLRSVWFGYVDLVHVRRENADLRGQIQRLRLEQAAIAQDAQQAKRLQHMLGFSEHYIYATQAAQVVGTSGTDQSQVILIDKGSKSGLVPDMPVITADGIVGKVKDVFRYTSQVLLVSDPTSGVGVILENTRIRGVLKGRAYGQLQVADVSPDARIKAGEPIVTSGGDQIFPRGLPVGTVERVLPDPDRDPLVDVLVRPAAKLSQLEEVLVVTSMSDAASPQETKDLAESEAEGEAAQKRASDVLSERLPSRTDPNAPADTNPENLTDAAGNAIRKTPPPKPQHADAFSPNAEPDAAQMSPGKRWAPVKDGTEDTTAALRPQPPQTAPAAAASPSAAPHAIVAKKPSASPEAPHKAAAPNPVVPVARKAAPKTAPPTTAPASGNDQAAPKTPKTPPPAPTPANDKAAPQILQPPEGAR